jgi:hypothetical protein
MICRLRIALPYLLYLDSAESLEPAEIQRGEYRVRIFPPHQSTADRSILDIESPVPLQVLADQLGPADPQEKSSAVSVQDAPGIPTDVLQIDFIAEQFDRSPNADDPPLELGFAIANETLSRLRTLGRAPRIRAVHPNDSVAQFEFLNDDGSQLEPAPPLVRTKAGAPMHFEVTVLPSVVWHGMWQLPDGFAASAWDTLFLDAKASLPEVGPSLVLAYAALESRITDALDVLAGTTGLDNGLWTWINSRGDDYAKQPSIAERFDALARALSGKSLKDEPRLWEAFQNVRAARNGYAHAGKAEIGRKEVSRDQATELIGRVGGILEWVDALLPIEHRRPSVNLSDIKIQITKSVIAGSLAQGVESPEPASDDN